MPSISFLLLGEGDFTYSLDLCRFLAASVATSAVNLKDSALDGIDSISITCTGIDTLHQLGEKYKDIDFVLRNIRKFNNIEQDRIRIETKILHGINAVEAECNDDDDMNHSNTIICQSFDHVIFNHPHLATEDAQLHSRFLQHLFHACVKRWMKPRTGLLHLTLVNGQCARWKCIEGAMKHGLVLLRRGAFYPPPPPPFTNIDNESTTKVKDTYYNLRRHQSGRSFANRRTIQSQDAVSQDNDSETLAFGRACDEYETVDSIGLLPWESIYCDIASRVPTNTQTLSCKYCSKTFHEHRSLKNHLVSLHPTSEEVRTWNIEKCVKRNKRRKLTNEGFNNCDHDVVDVKTTVLRQSDDEKALSNGNKDGIQSPPWTCSICEPPQLTSLQRIFPHKEALLAHQRAKHFGSHLDIKPDWHIGKRNINNEHDSSKAGDDDCSSRSCPICDKHFVSENEESLHVLEFLPSHSVSVMAVTQEFAPENRLRPQSLCTGNACTYCSRTFGGARARLQHENFCSLRPQEGV